MLFLQRFNATVNLQVGGCVMWYVSRPFPWMSSCSDDPSPPLPHHHQQQQDNTKQNKQETGKIVKEDFNYF